MGNHLLAVMAPELRVHVHEAQWAAEQTPILRLPGSGELTAAIDPPLTFAKSFREHLPTSVVTNDSRLTRADLLALGRSLLPDSDEGELLAFLFAVNAWGYGTSGRGLHRTLTVAEDNQAAFLGSARGAVSILHDPDRDSAAVDAYYYLLNQAAGHVTGWGPAFFTKFLAFADPANQPSEVLDRDCALILDQWIAAAVNHYLPEAFKSRKASRRSPLGHFGTTGWTTPQYAYYLRLVRQLTRESTFREAPYNGSPMAVERVLFHYFRDGEGRNAGVAEGH